MQTAENRYCSKVTYNPDDGGYYAEVWLVRTGQTVHTTEVFNRELQAAYAAQQWIAGALKQRGYVR